MKTLHYSIIAILVVAFAISLLLVIWSHPVQAICAYDKDWPQHPCYDELPGPSIMEKRNDWQRYYDLKGNHWM